jgi:hypothetical protein
MYLSAGGLFSGFSYAADPPIADVLDCGHFRRANHGSCVSLVPFAPVQELTTDERQTIERVQYGVSVIRAVTAKGDTSTT